MSPTGPPTDAHVRALAKQVLARPEYATWHSDSAAWLKGFLAWLHALPDTSPALYWTLLGGLALVVLVLLAHVVWTLRAALAAPVPPTSRRAAPEEAGFAEEAARLADEGRFLEAARRLQLAAIDLLLRHRVLELGRSDPNRTLRRRLRDAALPEPARGDMLALIDRLERSWFRDRSEDAALYAAWRALHVRLAATPGPA
jgi:hypothetical protein